MSDHHNHGNASGHTHTHGTPTYGRIFAIGVTLNLLFVIAEWLFGIYANSLSLVADAIHNLGDVLGLVLAWGASWLAQKKPDHRFTYGLKGTTILAALINAVSLLLVTGGLAWEAIHRLEETPQINEWTVISVASAGILVNGFTAWLFMAGGKSDLNMRGAYLHLAADAAVSAAVVVGAGLVMYTGWSVIDPVLTLMVSAVIVLSTWQMFTQSLAMALQAVPATIDGLAVKNHLKSLEGVTAVHDVHIWAMSTTENAMTAHLVMPAGHPGDAFLQTTTETFAHQFGIHHCTFQIELSNTLMECTLAPDHVI